MIQRLYSQEVSAGFHTDYRLDPSSWAGINLFWLCMLESILGTGQFPGMTQRLHTLGAVAGFHVHAWQESSLNHLHDNFGSRASAPENDKMLSPL